MNLDWPSFGVGYAVAILTTALLVIGLGIAHDRRDFH